VQRIEQKAVFVEDNFKSIIACCAQSPHDALKDGLVTEYLQTKGNPKDFDIKLLDPAVNLLINFPARTVYCKHIEACDVKTYLVDWANGEAKCRHCDEEFSDPTSEIYIDNFLLKALILYSESVTYRVSEDTFIPKNEKLQPHLLSKVIADNNKNKDYQVTYESERYKNKVSLKFNLSCSLSQRLMKNPITLRDCTHPACMDQEAYQSVQPHLRPARCPFPGCGEKMIESNLVKDMVVSDILGLKPQTMNVTYLLKKKNDPG